MAVPRLDLVKISGVKLLVPHIPHHLCCWPQRWDLQGEQGRGHRIPPLLSPIQSQKEEGIVSISLSGTAGFEALNSAAFHSCKHQGSSEPQSSLTPLGCVTFQPQQCSRGSELSWYKAPRTLLSWDSNSQQGLGVGTGSVPQ